MVTLLFHTRPGCCGVFKLSSSRHSSDIKRHDLKHMAGQKKTSRVKASRLDVAPKEVFAVSGMVRMICGGRSVGDFPVRSSLSNRTRCSHSNHVRIIVVERFTGWKTQLSSISEFDSREKLFSSVQIAPIQSHTSERAFLQLRCIRRETLKIRVLSPWWRLLNNFSSPSGIELRQDAVAFSRIKHTTAVCE